MLGGTTRMTISITVLVMETTGSMQLIIPLMITIFFAKNIGDRYSMGIYDTHIKIRGAPFLNEPEYAGVAADKFREYQILWAKAAVRDAEGRGEVPIFENCLLPRGLKWPEFCSYFAAHPVELRQQRVALAKFLDLLGIEAPDGIPEVGVRDFHVVATDQAGQGSQANPGARASRASQASRRGQKAATARWDRQRAQDERRRAAHGAPRT